MYKTIDDPLYTYFGDLVGGDNKEKKIIHKFFKDSLIMD